MATSGRISKVSESPSSRYTQGGEVDVYATRVGWWEKRKIKQDDTDIFIEIQPHEEKRPDLIAHNVYRRAALGWVVLQYNNIVDIETELTVGKEIRLPTLRRLTLDVLSRPIGGNPVT
jgi:hypothetical protein